LPSIFADAFSSFSPSITSVATLTRTSTRYASSASRLLQSMIPEGDYKEEEEEEEEEQSDAQLFFDDFGDFVAGSASADGPINSKSMTKLSERIQQTRSEEVRKDARLAKNWKTGNWGVRGFILDKSDPVRESVADTTTGTSSGESTDGANSESSSAPRLGGGGNKSGPRQDIEPIHVSAVVPDQSSFHDDHEEISAFDTIAVGRTDGTVLIVRIGTEYITTFTAVPKLRVDDKSAWDGDNEDVESTSIQGNDDLAKEGGPSVKVETELVNTEDLKKDLLGEDAGEGGGEKENAQYPMEDPFDELYGGGASGDLSSSPQEVPNPGTPFEVLHQIRAHEEVISALLFDDHTLYTAGGDSGEIRSWSIPEGSGEDNNDASVAVKMIPGKILSGAHSDRIVALKTLSSTQDAVHPDLLMSASIDGSFALWDIKSGDLVTRCQMLDDSAESIMINCADIDSGAGSNVIYFGTCGGYVVGYCVSDIIGNASAGGVCPIPSCRFQAHEQAVTSILAVGKGTSASSALPQARSTSILLTGGVDGSVKQWEMMSRTLQESKESDLSSPSCRLEHWPRLPNQRMKRRAHVFKGHSGPVNALAQVDSTKFLSASADGTVRVWSPSEGKEMYRMDGFTDSLTSLVLAKETLITDGMDNMVCIHDFDVDVDEADSGYELEW